MEHTEEKKSSKYILFSVLFVLIGLIGFGVYRNFQLATQTEKIGAQQPITYPVTPTPIATRCLQNTIYTIIQPAKYKFTKNCLHIPNQIYSDDTRFTFFNLPPYLRNISYVRTGNILEKEDKQLQWSVVLPQRADVYILYRKIPGQTPPLWIRNSYEKVTPNNFIELITYALRKNDLGLIGVYDIYKYRGLIGVPKPAHLPIPNGVVGTVQFGPATDTSVTAYSMYIVAIKGH
ncbi:MAG: hypothetical protein M3Q44_02735 [bacterium]|nr:hypothetical protein [bacterium]